MLNALTTKIIFNYKILGEIRGRKMEYFFLRTLKNEFFQGLFRRPKRVNEK